MEEDIIVGADEHACETLEHDEDIHTDSAEHSLTPVGTDTEHAVAPDGGWGWIVCGACFISHVLTDGIFYSFGVIYVELLDYFKGSKGETAIIASLSTGVCFLVGPVVALLANRFGCRVVASIGALLTSGGLVLSIFAPNIQFLYFSLGAVVGTGYGMIYLPSIVCVSQYFDKRRALATGIGVSGAGIGTFVFSPLTSLMIRTYSWQGTMLIQAGLVLNCLPCALIYRPISVVNPKFETQEEDSFIENGLETTGSNENNGVNDVSNSNVNSGIETDEVLYLKSYSCYNTDESIAKGISKHSNEPLLNRKTRQRSESSCKNTWTQDLKQKSVHKEKSEVFVIMRELLNSFDVNIFRNSVFCMFLVSTFFYGLGYYVPYVYLPDTAGEVGVDPLKASFLVSSVGITNTVGRVVFGFLSDRKCVNRMMLYATALVICGAATCLTPLLASYEMLLAYSVVFGASSGVTISLTSVLLTDIVGIHKLADALGVSTFFAGITSFLGPPIAGWMYDVSGNYQASYISAGAAIFLSGAMLFFVPCVGNKSKSKTSS